MDHKQLYNDARLTMKFILQGEDKCIDEDKAPLEAIRQMNDMIKYLINKLPTIKRSHWKYKG